MRIGARGARQWEMKISSISGSRAALAMGEWVHPYHCAKTVLLVDAGLNTQYGTVLVSLRRAVSDSVYSTHYLRNLGSGSELKILPGFPSYFFMTTLYSTFLATPLRTLYRLTASAVSAKSVWSVLLNPH